jgi:PPOX class probable F420-dependent enzyme
MLSALRSERPTTRRASQLPIARRGAGMLDLTTEFGARAERRLREDAIGWLVTVRPDGTPIPVPVWFVWDGESILVYSQPRTGKVRNIAANPRAALHLRTDEHGDDVVVLIGTARVDPGAPRGDANPAFVAKYAGLIAGMHTTVDAMAADYSVGIRFVPDRVSGF